MTAIPDWLNRKLQQELHEKGIEMTLEEVIANRKTAHQAIREGLRKRGIESPEGDLEMLDWLKMVGL